MSLKKSYNTQRATSELHELSQGHYSVLKPIKSGIITKFPRTVQFLIDEV